MIKWTGAYVTRDQFVLISFIGLVLFDDGFSKRIESELMF
jgi:hypothetical protein